MFYEKIEVELILRNQAKEMPRIFFLVLFACSRDSFVEHELIGEKLDYLLDPSRGLCGNTPKFKTSNFTFVFGSNPATGSQADPKFVTMFLKHLDQMFDPEDGALLLPECLGNIDTLNGTVNFESTSSNVGKGLKLKRQDCRVGAKQIIVIIQNPKLEGVSTNKDGEEFRENFYNNFNTEAGAKKSREVWKTLSKAGHRPEPKVGIVSLRTHKVLDFFIEDLGFEESSVIFFTEHEARKLI